LSLRFAPFAAAALFVHLVGCAEEPASTNDMGAVAPASTPSPETVTGKLVLAFGDSLYAGYGVAPNESFPAELQARLKAAGVDATVRNAGVSGDTTAAGRQRLAYTLDGLPRKPDLVVLGLGGNDMLRGIDPGQTEANLRFMLDELKKRDVPVLLTGMVAAPNLGREYGARFNAIYPELAKDYGAPLYPFFLDGVVTDQALMLPDRIHPNPAGIDRVAERVAPLVAEELR
jgi:acyl-CoA thioesterase I